jgi:formylmethanofuran dehydrogenase subunit E
MNFDCLISQLKPEYECEVCKNKFMRVVVYNGKLYCTGCFYEKFLIIPKE